MLRAELSTLTRTNKAGSLSHERDPLHYAAAKGYVHVCRLLVEGGANVNGQERENVYERKEKVATNTPLFVAVLYRSVGIVELLIENQAEVNVKNAKSNRTALHVAVGEIDCLREIDYHYKDYNKPTSRSNVPHEGICKKLVKGRADVNIQDGDGATALHSAVTSGSESICKLLLEYLARQDGTYSAAPCSVSRPGEHLPPAD
eukprot:1249592-Rhodomonas_salina.1